MSIELRKKISDKKVNNLHVSSNIINTQDLVLFKIAANNECDEKIRFKKKRNICFLYSMPCSCT